MTSPLNQPADLTPAGPRRQQRSIQVPQLLLSLLVVLIFALLALWWQRSTTTQVPALALATDVAAGVPIERTDLTEILISVDGPGLFTDPANAAVFVGVSPRVDLRRGTIITVDMFRQAPRLGPNEALVGFVVDADEAPTGLAPGDWVQVIGPGPDDEPLVYVPDAVVEVVDRLDQATWQVRLRMGIEQAQLTQSQADDIVLVEVDNQGTPAWADPAGPDDDGEEGGS